MTLKKNQNKEKKPGKFISFEKKIAKDRLHEVLEKFQLDDVDLQLLSEFQEPVSISTLKGKYRLGRRSLYYRAARLVSKGLVTYKKAGIVKLYFLTSGGKKIIANCLIGCDREAASSSKTSSSSSPYPLYIRNHNILYEMPIHTQPKALHKMLEKGNWVTGVKWQNMNNWLKPYGDYQFNGFIAHVIITTKKVLVRIKDIWEENIPLAVDRGADQILAIKHELEETFSWPGHRKFRLGNWKRRNVAIVRGSHQAIVHHPLAEKCNAIGYSINGERWSVDASQGIPEAEATDAPFSADEADFEHQDLEWRTRNQVGVRQLKESIDDMMSFLEKSTQLQNSLTQQIQNLSQSDNNVMQLVVIQSQLLNQLLQQQAIQTKVLMNIQTSFSQFFGGKA